MATVVKELTGRSWEVVRSNGVNFLSSADRVFEVYSDTGTILVASGGEALSYTGIPALGDAHPADANCIAKSYKYDEGTDGDCVRLKVTVHYEPRGFAEETFQSFGCAVEDWGWDAGTENRELVSDAVSGNQVVNSAGDPFDQVPQYASYSPTFQKVIKTTARHDDWLDYNSRVNSAAVEVGGLTCAKHALLCSVAVSRIFGDTQWKYKYTIQLHRKTNIVSHVVGAASTAARDIGWDVGIVDSGMRELSPTTEEPNRKAVIRLVDKETQKQVAVSSPALLNGNGYAISATDTDQNARVLVFAAYQEATFPSEFYSEPS